METDGGGRKDTLEARLSATLEDLRTHEEELRVQNEELRIARDALELSQQRYAQLFEMAPIGYITLDTGGVVAEINLAAADLLGWDRSRVIGKHFRTFVAPAHRDAFDAHLRRVISGHPFVEELAIKAQTGAEIPVILTSSLLREHGKGRTTVLMTALDIADRKKAEVEIREAQQQAEAASQVKSQFLSHMSHELRTPLNAIMGFTDLMLAGVMGEIPIPKYQEYLADIHASADHLLSIISDILDMSKIEAGKMELEEKWVDLRVLAERSARLVDGMAKDVGVDLGCLLPEVLPLVRLDERRFMQILINLLSNAIKFTPRGGVVTLTVKEAGGGVMVEIADTGTGIAADQIERAFEPFTQLVNGLSRRTPGTGLGLPLASELTRLHGGTLRLTSSVNLGTRVVVTLPADRVGGAAPFPSQ